MLVGRDAQWIPIFVTPSLDSQSSSAVVPVEYACYVQLTIYDNTKTFCPKSLLASLIC